MTPCGAEPAPSGISVVCPVFRVEPAQLAGVLGRVPDRPVGRDRHVVRVRPGRHRVLLDAQAWGRVRGRCSRRERHGQRSDGRPRRASVTSTRCSSFADDPQLWTLPLARSRFAPSTRTSSAYRTTTRYASTCDGSPTRRPVSASARHLLSGQLDEPADRADEPHLRRPSRSRRREARARRRAPHGTGRATSRR